MNGSSVNSSRPPSTYYWGECDSSGDDAAEVPGPSAGLAILFSTFCFEFLVGVPANLWLICDILGKRSKASGVLPADFFPLHLGFIQLPFYLAIPLFFVNHYWLRLPALLTVETYLNGLVLVLKPLFFSLVCVERYLAVVLPILYLRLKAPRYRWSCVAVSWCIYIIMASVTVGGRSTGVLCGLFIPVLVIDTFCSLSVLKTLQKPPPGDGKMRGSSEQRVNGEMNAMKKKAFTTIVIIQAVLTLNYLPMIITLFLGGHVEAHTMKCQYAAMSIAAATSCSYLQPLLYMHKLGRLPCTTAKNA